jgi:hypothetical protein
LQQFLISTFESTFTIISIIKIGIKNSPNPYVNYCLKCKVSYRRNEINWGTKIPDSESCLGENQLAERITLKKDKTVKNPGFLYVNYSG